MSINTHLDTIRSYDIPTTDHIQATIIAKQHNLSCEEYNNRIKHIVNVDFEFYDNIAEAQYMYWYTIQECIRLYNQKPTCSIENVWSHIQDKCNTLFNIFPHLLNNNFDQGSISGTKRYKIVGKKGRKKILAKQLYNKYKDTIDRNQMKQMFIDQVQLTVAGANTYYSNFKTGKW